MAGEDRAGEVAAYLTRLMGEAVSADQPLRLRSVHRAALSSWARKQTLPLNLPVLNSGQSFSVAQLLSADEIAAPVAPARTAPSQVSAGSFTGVGIDIEDVASLPHADDHREHPFFRDHFTSAEISYCLRQPDARASFCGTWAAKEAILKSGLIAMPSGRLNAIELLRDGCGRPVLPGCQLSISHTTTTAVAVCIALSAQTVVSSSPVETPADEPVAAVPRARRAVYAVMAGACAAMIVVIGALSFVLHAWP